MPFGGSAPAAGGYTSPQQKGKSDDQLWTDWQGQHPGAGPLFNRNDVLRDIHNQQDNNPYQNAAEAQATANRPTQNSPFASSGWQQDPKTGQWTQNVGLNPGLQGAAEGFMGQLGGSAGADARKHAEDAIYARETSRLDPMWNQRENQYGTQLANQGLDSQSEAYKNAMGDFGRQRNDAYSSAMQDAIMGGGAEQQRQQGLAMGGLEGLQGLTGMPGFQQGPNYLGAVQGYNGYNLEKSQQDNQWWSDLIGGGAMLGAGALAGRGR